LSNDTAFSVEFIVFRFGLTRLGKFVSLPILEKLKEQILKLTFIKQIIFDADDTLWENNVYYVQATNDLLDLFEKAGLDRRQIQKEFDELELYVVKERGYGSHNFVWILESLYERYKDLIDRPTFEKIVDRFRKHPNRKPQLFEGVIETLKYLKEKYHLYVLTKGEFKEQELKIINSGVHQIVDAYFIVPEKDDQVYREILKQHHWKAEETCMVGNSPKSDINPALRVGMYAIHIPYRDTWKLDDEPIQKADNRFFQLKKFTELKELF